MPFRLEACTKSDVPEIVDCIFDAYSHPRYPFVDLLFPGAGSNNPEGKPFAIQQYSSRWGSNPYEVWIKAIDTETNKVAG
jgi:hypothetical protein